MTTRQSNQTLRASIRHAVVGVVCAGALAAAIPGSAQGAERDICDKMSGEQLRRCIEASSREQPAPANTGPPARPSGVPTTGGALILPPAPGKAAASAQPTNLRILNCTQVSYVDQPFCAYRNTALLECANRGKYPDPGRCYNDTMSRSPDLVAADCREVPEAHQANCHQRNKVYAQCKNDKMNYLACLETKMGKQK